MILKISLLSITGDLKVWLVYTFVNPNEKEEVEQEAMQAGVQPRTINTNQKDQFKLQKNLYRCCYFNG